MYKQSPSRGHRSKGIKVKHILQICLLLAVCFWLIYQVKHSHEKRREFEAKDEKVVNKVQTDGQSLRFGRKDLPKVTEIATGGEKRGEDEEEREAEEEEEEHRPVEEENKHEEDEPEIEDVRTGEREDERGGGDDEIDENEPEKKEAEHAHGEELVDEDKVREEIEESAEENHAEIEEKEDSGKEEHPEVEENDDAAKEGRTDLEENEDVDKEDHNERDVALDDQDHEGESTNTHEAREELYKADDASSEVAHDVQNINPETENVTMGQANEMFGNANFGQENETKVSNNPDALTKAEVQPREDGDNGISNVTVAGEKKYEANFDDGSLQNSTSTSLSNNQPLISSNSTARNVEHSPLSNGTQMSFDANLSQNATVEGATADKDVNMLGNVLEHTNKSTPAADVNNHSEASSHAGESLNSSNATVASSYKTNETNSMEAVKDSSIGNESQGEESKNREADGSDGSSKSHSYDEGEDTIQHDPIDASDTSVTEEEKESRTDLDTLPDIRTEVQNTEEATTE